MISLRLALVSAGGSPFTEPSVPAPGAHVLGTDLNCSESGWSERLIGWLVGRGGDQNPASPRADVTAAAEAIAGGPTKQHSARCRARDRAEGGRGISCLSIQV
jgi:hypothetical protein